MMIERHVTKTFSPCYTLLIAVVLALGAQGCTQQVVQQPVVQEAAKLAEPAKAKPIDAIPAPAPIVEQPALDRLKAMSDKLVAAKALTYHSRSTMEMPAKTGQFLTYFIDGEVALQRPNKLRASVSGDVPGFRFYYDGANISALDPTMNLYASASAPGTIDEMLPLLMEKTGIEFPAEEFLVSNPYAEMTKDLTHAIVVGMTKVNGIPCDHFAFMSPTTNWEVWIESGKDALPRRVAVTYKAVENFPRFQVEFLDWNLKPKLNTSEFVFKKPAGAKQIEFDSRADQLSQ